MWLLRKETARSAMKNSMVQLAQNSVVESAELPNIEKVKSCSKCKVEKPLTPEFYHKEKSRINGFQPACKCCRSRRAIKGIDGMIFCSSCNTHKQASTDNFQRNRIERGDKISTCSACRVGKNKARMVKLGKKKQTELAQDYYAKNKESVKIRVNKYRVNNQEAISERKAKHYKENPLLAFIRHTISRIESAKGSKRKERTMITLGYSQDEFIEHIESQFIDGMCWENRSEFHIDHIKPVSLFLKEGITDIKIINALSNLQPLWAKDNLSKGAKYNEQ